MNAARLSLMLERSNGRDAARPALAVADHGLLLCTRREYRELDLQLTFTPASYQEGVQGQLENEPGMTVASWQQRPESRAMSAPRSAIRSKPDHPDNYLTEELDRRMSSPA